VKVKELYQEIVKQMENRSHPDVAFKKIAQAKYFGVNINSYGLEESEQTELFKCYNDALMKLSLEERFEIAGMLKASGFSEQVGFGDRILYLSLDEITPDHYELLDEIGDYLNDWGDTDWFCIRILQPLLRQYTMETLELLRKWNKSDQIWKQRASVVAFTRKIGESGKFTNEVLKLCENLIWSKEDYVRKGVGWALKDNMRGSKKKVLDYVKSLRERGVSSVITLYAIRDLKGRERSEVLDKKPKMS